MKEKDNRRKEEDNNVDNERLIILQRGRRCVEGGRLRVEEGQRECQQR